MELERRCNLGGGNLHGDTFFLALYFLKQERRRELVRQAKSVAAITAYGDETDSGGELIKIHVWNYSERPIFRLDFRWFYDSWEAPVGHGEILEGRSDDYIDFLLPEKSVTFTHVLKKTETFGFWGVFFQDADRQIWVIDLRTEELISIEQFIKWLLKESIRRRRDKSAAISPGSVGA